MKSLKKLINQQRKVKCENWKRSIKNWLFTNPSDVISVNVDQYDRYRRQNLADF